MRVNVFIVRENGQLTNELLVLPLSPEAAIPKERRDNWRYYSTVDTADSLFGDIDARAIEAEIGANGFALVVPVAPDRR